MQELTEEDKEQIFKILKKANRKVWKDEIINKVITNIQKARDGTIKLNDYLVPNILSWQDYFDQLYLTKFVNGTQFNTT